MTPAEDRSGTARPVARLLGFCAFALPIAFLGAGGWFFRRLIPIPPETMPPVLLDGTSALYAADVGGRYTLGVASTLLALLSALGFLVAGWALLGMHGRRRGVVLLVLGVVLGALIGMVLTKDPNWVRVRVVDDVLRAAVATGALAAGASEWSSRLLLVDRFVGVIGATTVMVAMAATAWRSPGKAIAPADLLMRRQMLSRLLLCNSAILIASVFATTAVFDWPAGLLKAENGCVADQLCRASAAAVGRGATLYWGMLSSLLLVLTYGPALGALSVDMARAAPAGTIEEREAWLKRHGLQVAVSDSLTRLAATMAPLLSAPIIEGLGKIGGL